MLQASVSINLSGLEKFEKDINEQLNGKPGPVNNALKLWAVRYRSYVQLRFDLFSRGGGNWQALAASTIKARRKGKSPKSTSLTNRAKNAGGTFSILRDKGLLFSALNPVFIGAPGAVEQQIPFGIKVGYGGPSKHGDGKVATIADIASFHQNGAIPHLPKREIIVAPDQALLTTMASDMQKAMYELAE